ncbi:hypothetical protein [Sphingobium sp. HDIP04]|uniref:hypothetical protein n=1 Tax=Sphingobium sp. HDIP04 TaxID=428994 RepID=UPI00038778AD|nr:hypothetical protein [Sphingobium sp. HDIP04]EQB03921.1 hypothetical protein L286_11190 [Sphingobium sp. HDIP04]
MLNNFTLPQTAFDVQPMPQQQAPAPFVWGQGGARLTPEQLLAEQEMARDRMKSDYSPVSSVWQGLGRVADNWLGALDARRLDKEQAAVNADRTAMIAQMLGPENADIAAVLASGDKTAASLADNVLSIRNPKARNPFEFEQMLSAGGYVPGTPEYQEQVRSMIERKSDPFITANLPSGDFYAGPQSGFGLLLKGGDPASGVVPGTVGSSPPANIPTAPVGKLTPIGGGSGNAVSPFP